MVIQALDGGDMKGDGDADDTPRRADPEAAMATIAELHARMAASGSA